MKDVKELKVKFNNVWDEYGDCDPFEIIIFKMPKDMDIDIQKEVDILDACHTILCSYTFDDDGNICEEDMADFIEELREREISETDIEIAKSVLDYGNYGLIADRIAEFIYKKYPEIDYETQNDCDIEINIE